MSGINKVILVGDEYDLYSSGLSIPEVSKKTGIALSTLRFRLHKKGILRSRKDGVINARDKGLLGSGMRGKKRTFTKEWKNNMSLSKKGKGKGFSLKPSGYIDITMGENKGRHQHVVIMEDYIGRKLIKGECVHHIDGCKTNNDINNLKLMSVSEHSSYHAKMNYKLRNRSTNGRFI